MTQTLPDIKENLIERIEMRQHCEKNLGGRAALMELCRRPGVGIKHFFRWMLWTYDPRLTPSDRPFILWDYQEAFVSGLNEDIMAGKSQLTEKSRDMGVTWMVLGTLLYRWLFFDESFLLGSRTEEEVDKIGDMKALFERLRYMIEKLPAWMLEECGFNKRNSGFMKIYKANGASLTGSSMNANFSRQGRFKAILLDEFAFVESPQTIWRACGDAAPCKLPVSTPNGSNNFFAQLRKQMHGSIKVSTLHWKQHPFKDEKWYEAQKENRSVKDIAQELDINYNISAGDPFYQGFSRALHLRKMRISQDRELILGWDYGFRHPNCSIHQITTEGTWIIVDNIFGEDQTIDEFGAYVIEYLNQHWAGYQYRHNSYGDPAGTQSSDKSRKSSQQILNEMGFKVRSIPSNTIYSNYAARKSIIEKKLRTLIGGVPALVINDVPNNQMIVEGFEGGYRYPDANKYGGTSEKPIDDGWFEHPFNSIEYVAIHLFKPFEHKPRPSAQGLPPLLRKRVERETVNAGFGF